MSILSMPRSGTSHCCSAQQQGNSVALSPFRTGSVASSISLSVITPRQSQECLCLWFIDFKSAYTLNNVNCVCNSPSLRKMLYFAKMLLQQTIKSIFQYWQWTFYLIWLCRSNLSQSVLLTLPAKWKYFEKYFRKYVSFDTTFMPDQWWS